MKGFKDSSGKFHPINQSKGVRSKRDTIEKTKGVRLKRKTEPRISFSLLDKTENQLYELRDELSDQQEQETWLEVNRLIDKIQKYKMRYYGGTGSKFDPERKSRSRFILSQKDMWKDLEDFLYNTQIAGTVDEFYGNEDEEEDPEYNESGLWLSGESGNLIGGKDGDNAFAYWAESDDYDGGIHKDMRKFLDERGWWAEWNDAGTVMLYKD